MSLRPATAEPRWVRTGLLGITLLFLGAFLVTPLVAVFAEAFRKGHLGIMDYYRMRNVQADTAMRGAIAGSDQQQPGQ